MHRTNRYVASLFLTVALAAPVSMMAAPAPQEVGVQVRVYDRNHPREAASPALQGGVRPTLKQ